MIVYLAPAVELTGLPIVDELIALGWVVGITNAFNLLDNMDGLCVGHRRHRRAASPDRCCSEDGATPTGASPSPRSPAPALGFLVYNFQPASIFMGDSGSLFLGSFAWRR